MPMHAPNQPVPGRTDDIAEQMSGAGGTSWSDFQREQLERALADPEWAAQQGIEVPTRPPDYIIG